MPAIQKEIMDLWRIVFKDTEEFIQFYFKQKFKPGNCAYIYDNGQVVASLLMLPYTINFYNTSIPVSYISGAVTRPEARGQGLMRQLLSLSLVNIQEHFFGFSVLIPQEEWLYDYYARFGYVSLFKFTPETHEIKAGKKYPNIQILSREETLHDIEELYDYFYLSTYQRSFAIQHDFEDFGIVVEDLYMSGGLLYVSRNTSNQLNGMAFVLPEAGHIHVPELIADNAMIIQSLLETIASVYRQKIICQSMAYPPNEKRGGMIRITSALQILQQYASVFPEKSLHIHLTDPIIPSNNGFYLLSKGKCTFSTVSKAPADVEMNIAELTGFVFSSPPYINLMLE